MVEYTARSTPQRNSPVEVKFTHLAGRVRAAFNRTNIPKEERYILFQEFGMTITKLDWLGLRTIDGVTMTKIEHYKGKGKLPKFVANMRVLGEAGTVKIGKDGKVGDRGVTMIFVGYADDNAGDVYRMYNPFTKYVVVTRDVMWLKRMFYERANNNVTLMDPVVAIEAEDNIGVDHDIADDPNDEVNSDDEASEEEVRE